MGLGDALAGAGSGAAAGSMFGPWGSIIGAGIGLFGNLFGAHMQSKSADQAAKIAAEAARYAADLQAKAQADALAFQDRMATNSFLNSEAARQGNYGLYKARELNLGPLSEAVGLGGRNIAPYVPGVDPRTNGAGANRAGSAAPDLSGVSALPETFDPKATAALYATAYPGESFDAGYWSRKWPELVARGKELQDPLYAAKRVLGWQAGGADVPTAGPYAGAGGAAPSMFQAPRGGAPVVTATPFIRPVMAPTVAQSLGYYA